MDEDRLSIRGGLQSEAQAKAQTQALAEALRQGGQDLASKADIAELRTATKADIAELRAATKADIVELRTATKADIAELRTETKLDIADLKTGLADLKAEIQAMINRLLLTLISIIVGSMVAMTGIFAAIVKWPWR